MKVLMYVYFVDQVIAMSHSMDGFMINDQRIRVEKFTDAHNTHFADPKLLLSQMHSYGGAPQQWLNNLNN